MVPNLLDLLLRRWYKGLALEVLLNIISNNGGPIGLPLILFTGLRSRMFTFILKFEQNVSWDTYVLVDNIKSHWHVLTDKRIAPLYWNYEWDTFWSYLNIHCHIVVNIAFKILKNWQKQMYLKCKETIHASKTLPAK